MLRSNGDAAILRQKPRGGWGAGAGPSRRGVLASAVSAGRRWGAGAERSFKTWRAWFGRIRRAAGEPGEAHKQCDVLARWPELVQHWFNIRCQQAIAGAPDGRSLCHYPGKVAVKEAGDSNEPTEETRSFLAPGVELLEHTADVGMQVRASSLEELFHRAALGLVGLMRGSEESIAGDETSVADGPEGDDAQRDTELERDDAQRDKALEEDAAGQDPGPEGDAAQRDTELEGAATQRDTELEEGAAGQDPGPEGGVAQRSLELDAPDLAALLAAWLRELLYLDEVEGFQYQASRFHGLEVGEDGAGRLQASVLGKDASGHRTCELKAVTYHQLEVRETGGAWRARVYFDI